MGGDESMSDIKTTLFAVADSLGMNMRRDDDILTGNRKTTLDLFEGYSPTIITEIVDSLVDELNEVVGVKVRVWGNLGVLLIAEQQRGTIHAFVYDRSAAPQDPVFVDNKWSRARTYAWLEGCVKGIYHRFVYDYEWQVLDQPAARLKAYNKARRDDVGARQAYELIWGGSK